MVSYFGNGKRKLEMPVAANLPVPTEVHDYYGGVPFTENAPQNFEPDITKMAEAISKLPLDEIAKSICDLTYEEHMTLSTDLAELLNIPKVDRNTIATNLHIWAKRKKDGES